MLKALSALVSSRKARERLDSGELPNLLGPSFLPTVHGLFSFGRRSFGGHVFVSHATRHKTRILADEFCKVGSHHLAPFILNPEVSTFVPALFACCGPSNVFWAVHSVVVDSFQRVECRRFWRHVLLKREVRLGPTSAHKNAAASVQRVCRVRFVEASLHHAQPGDVQGATLARDCVFAVASTAAMVS